MTERNYLDSSQCQQDADEADIRLVADALASGRSPASVGTPNADDVSSRRKTLDMTIEALVINLAESRI